MWERQYSFMAGQTKRRYASSCKIFVSLSYLLGISLVIFLSLVVIVSPVTSHTSLLAKNKAHIHIRPVAKPKQAWVLMDDTAIYPIPGSSQTFARVSQHTAVSLTGYSQKVNRANWVQVTWDTGKQSHTGWIQAKFLTTQSFSGLSSASIGMLSTRLQDYLSSFGSAVGVTVYLPATDQYYCYNASQQFPMASSMKVPIMLTMLSQVEKQNRPLTESEAQQLKAMIESSDNDAAESLYQEVGTASGVMNFLNSHELSGIVPDPNTWGTSTASPQAMVNLLSALFAGELLSATETAYALSLMQNVTPDQRFGVGDTAPRGSIVSMKNGWLLLDQGWAVNSSGIVQTPGITYILSVYTMGGTSQESSMRIIATIYRQIVTALM
jgi:beta-lactamase class A